MFTPGLFCVQHQCERCRSARVATYEGFSSARASSRKHVPTQYPSAAFERIHDSCVEHVSKGCLSLSCLSVIVWLDDKPVFSRLTLTSSSGQSFLKIDRELPKCQAVLGSVSVLVRALRSLLFLERVAYSK